MNLQVVFGRSTYVRPSGSIYIRENTVSDDSAIRQMSCTVTTYARGASAVHELWRATTVATCSTRSTTAVVAIAYELT